MNATCTPYQHYDWLKPWCDHVAPAIGAEPKIVLGYTSDDKLVFILPFMLTRQFGITTCQWLGGKIQNINAGLYDPDWLKQCDKNCFNEVLTMIQNMFNQVDAFDFSYNSPTFQNFDNPFYINLSTTKSVHLFYQKTFMNNSEENQNTALSRETKKRDQRQLNSLTKEFDELAFFEVKTMEDQKKALEIYLKLSTDRFASKGISNAFAGQHMTNFLREVTTNSALKFSCFMVQKEIVAVLGLLKSNNHWSGFVQAIDMDRMKNYSIGRLHIHHFIENSYAKNLKEIDIGLGKEPYKEAHFDAVQMHDALIANSMKGNFAVIYLRVKRGFMRMIRNSDFMWSLVVKFRKIIRLRI